MVVTLDRGLLEIAASVAAAVSVVLALPVLAATDGDGVHPRSPTVLGLTPAPATLEDLAVCYFCIQRKQNKYIGVSAFLEDKKQRANHEYTLELRA
jgi:hypothetical protein